MRALRPAVPPRRHGASRHARGYTNNWARRSKRAIAEWIAANGMVCPGVAQLAIERHPVTGLGSERLTGNHITSLQVRRLLGVPLVDNERVEVMCQGCNTRLGEAERRELAGVPRGNPTTPSPERFVPATIDPWFA